MTRQDDDAGPSQLMLFSDARGWAVQKNGVGATAPSEQVVILVSSVGRYLIPPITNRLY